MKKKLFFSAMLLFTFYNNTILSKYYHTSKKNKKRNSKRQSKGGLTPAPLIQISSINKTDISNASSTKKPQENNLFDEHSINNISLGGKVLEETMEQIEENKKNTSSEKETEFISINYENYPFEMDLNDEFKKNNIEYIIEEDIPLLLCIFIIKMIFESQKITYKKISSNQKIELSLVKIKKKIKQNELYEALAWLVDNIDIYKKIIFISINNILGTLGNQKKQQEKSLWSKIKNLFSAKQNNSIIKTKNKLLEQLKKLSKIHSELNEENIEEILYLLIHNINTHPHTFLNTIIDENFFKYALYNMSTKKKQNTCVTKKEDQKENKKEKIDSASEKTIESETITSKDLLAFYIKTVLDIFEN